MKNTGLKIGKNKDKTYGFYLKEGKISIIAVIIFLSLTSCEKAWHGSDGHPGNAYLALTWQVTEPTYLDAGSGSIPPTFFWGENYRTWPGNYFLYYEGRMWNGMYWSWYAWEVEYSIWEIPGEPGDWYYHGTNGPDNFFNIECNPYGPYVSHFHKSSDPVLAGHQIENDGETISVTIQENGYEMIIQYKKVKPRKVSEEIQEIAKVGTIK
ncbi:MAG: hypothetical protein K8R53_15930 [Bacteroidales bacterium]|nr:hypothetical protein [Bacteroidales bacterium]